MGKQNPRKRGDAVEDVAALVGFMICVCATIESYKGWGAGRSGGSVVMFSFEVWVITLRSS